jgi:hypothetical protein
MAVLTILIFVYFQLGGRMVKRTKPGRLAAAKLEEFHSHDPEVVEEKVITSPKPDGRDARITKTVRMKLRLSEMLRDESYRRTIDSGNKVAEADLIEEALTDWQIKNKVRCD